MNNSVFDKGFERCAIYSAEGPVFRHRKHRIWSICPFREQHLTYILEEVVRALEKSGVHPANKGCVAAHVHQQLGMLFRLLCCGQPGPFLCHPPPLYTCNAEDLEPPAACVQSNGITSRAKAETALP